MVSVSSTSVAISTATLCRTGATAAILLQWPNTARALPSRPGRGTAGTRTVRTSRWGKTLGVPATMALNWVRQWRSTQRIMVTIRMRSYEASVTAKAAVML